MTQAGHGSTLVECFGASDNNAQSLTKTKAQQLAHSATGSGINNVAGWHWQPEDPTDTQINQFEHSPKKPT